MTLSARANEAVGRLLNGKNNPQAGAIAHLASAAGRSVESLVYLADLDDDRFKGIWPSDQYSNDSVDDGHVRWAAAGALTSLDLCIAAAGRLSGFAQRPPRDEDSIRTFYVARSDGTIVVEKRDLVQPPWRAWIDALVADSRYGTLLRVRNALIHADVIRATYGTTDAIQGHALRYDYDVGALQPVHASTHVKMKAREIVELSRDVAVQHVGSFVAFLESL